MIDGSAANHLIESIVMYIFSFIQGISKMTQLQMILASNNDKQIMVGRNTLIKSRKKLKIIFYIIETSSKWPLLIVYKISWNQPTSQRLDFASDMVKLVHICTDLSVFSTSTISSWNIIGTVGIPP